MPEGGQSPPPERQSGKQLHDTPASGQGADSSKDKKNTMEKEVEALQSNPKGPMDASLESKFSKEGNEMSYN